MIKVGLTGNIGSGKSTVCKIFELLDVPVFYSDREAKKLYSRADVKEQLEHQFGKSVFNSSYHVEFKKLAAIIFSNKKSLEFVNHLIHPLVFELYDQWLIQHKNSSYTVHESAILYEHHLENKFDKNIVVYCPEQIRLNRVMNRDNVIEQEVKKRMTNQMADDLKNKQADFIIINDGVEMVVPQVMEINSRLRGTIITS